MRRVIVAGTSGAGKTTTARRISERLGIPHTELDGLRHGPNWQRRAEFEADVEAFSAQSAWVTEWAGGDIGRQLAERADTMVWLHFRRTTVMTRLVRRTLHRRLRRTVLWNGNVEPPLWTFFTSREHVIRWGWNTHRERGRQVRTAALEHPSLQVIELRNQRQVDRWLEPL